MKLESYVLYKVVDGKVKYFWGEEEVHTHDFVENTRDVWEIAGFQAEPAKTFFHKLLEARLDAARKYYPDWFH